MLCDDLEGWDGVGGSFRKAGACACIWLIHANAWQEPTQRRKAIILQLKINTFLKKVLMYEHSFLGYCEIR